MINGNVLEVKGSNLNKETDQINGNSGKGSNLNNAKTGVTDEIIGSANYVN